MRKNHEIPQYYLSGFCDPYTQSKLWVFRHKQAYKPGSKAGANNPALLGLRTIALRPDAYAARDINGKTHYSYEEALNRKIEQRSNPVIEKVRAFVNITVAEKQLLAEYILTMIKRRTARDARIKPLIEKHRATLMETAEREIRITALSGDLNKAFKIRHRAAHYDDNWFLRESMIGLECQIGDAGLVRQVLTKRLWEFITAPTGHYFVTSDNPVVGTGDLQRTLLFPISQTVVLTYATALGNDLAYRQATPYEMRGLNALIISQADEEVYSPQPEQWIHQGWAEGFVITN